MSFNHLSSAIIGVLIGLLLLAIGPIIECENLAGTTMTLQCPDGAPVSSLWPSMALIVSALGIVSWLYRNRTKP